MNAMLPSYIVTPILLKIRNVIAISLQAITSGDCPSSSCVATASGGAIALPWDVVTAAVVELKAACEAACIRKNEICQ
jgi:hypothetical protein